MKLKKINAGLALLTAATGLIHIIYNVISYLMFIHNEMLTHIIADVFMTLTIIHAVLGMIAITVMGDGSSIKLYPKQNMNTIIQRITGMIMFPLLFLHANTFDLLMKNAKIGNTVVIGLLIVVQILFFGDVLAHIALSIPRALITLGRITSQGQKKRIDRIVFVICGCLFAAAVYAVTKTDIALVNMVSEV